MLPTIATVLGILAILIPAGIAVVKLIEKRQRRLIDVASLANDQTALLAKLGEEMLALSTALQAHMTSEDAVSVRIEALGNQLIEDIARLDAKGTARALSLAKATAGVTEVPTIIHRVWHGDYALEWANDAYLHLVDLTLEEATSGGWWLSIAENERDLIKDASESVGQSQEDYHGEYTMVNARTQEPIGTAVSRGYVIPGAIDGEWHYVSQIRVTPLTSTPEVD